MADEHVVITTRDIYEAVIGMQTKLDTSIARMESHGEAIGGIRVDLDRHDKRIGALERDAAVQADRESREGASKQRQPGWWAVGVALFVGCLSATTTILTLLTRR